LPQSLVLRKRGGYNLAVNRPQRAHQHFRRTLESFFEPAPTLRPCAALIADALEQLAPGTADFPAHVRPLYEDLTKVKSGTGTLADAIEWEIVKLQARVRPAQSTTWPPLLRDRHVHIGSLIHLWRDVASETEDAMAAQGMETFFDIGPWGGFNFVVNGDGYTRMKFSRLTLGVGSLSSTPLTEEGGAFFDIFMPQYKSRLAEEGLIIPEEWQYRNVKRDPSERLVELSSTYYFPHHTYDNRTFVKVRLSREFETYEEIMVWDFLELLGRLYHTTDWTVYKQDTKDVDVRFDLQDFVSLSHIMERVYQRTEKEERLLAEIKEAFRGPIRERPVLYDYLDRLVRSKWVENLTWAIAGRVLGIRKFERPFSFARDILIRPLAPQLLIPVKCHVQAYHDRIGASRPMASQ
jgi:hypothetical protein